MKWHPAVINGETYDLSHLHPITFTLALEARGKHAAATFEIDVIFGLHCFTEALQSTSPAALHYSDRKETRCFNLDRYMLSLQLPKIIISLDRRRCYRAKLNNYMTFEMAGPAGSVVHYQVYFQVTKSKAKEGRLTLFVQSAYPKDVPQKVQREKPCLFKTICVTVAA